MTAASTANASGQTVIGASGTVYVGTPGATVTAPAAENSVLDTDLVELGFITPDGIKFQDSKDVGELKAWQTPYAVRRFVTGREFTASFAMEQWNWHTVPFAFGGGTLTEPTSGHYLYTPPDADDLDPRALVVDWVDGGKHYRLWVPSGLVVAPVEVSVKRDEGSTFPVEFGAIFDGTNAPWQLFTDDPAFEVSGA